MLLTTYNFIGTEVTLTSASRSLVTSSLRKPTMQSYDSLMLSRLLNRQIKSSMHTLRQELMQELLEELDRKLKQKSRAEWTTCFCIVIIICFCIEEAQISMDSFTVHTHVNGDRRDRPPSDVTIQTCRRLDDLLVEHLLELFHGMFKTHPGPRAQSGSRTFNPIAATSPKIPKEALDEESWNLVNDVREVIDRHSKQQ